jgi:hypothetical protein
MADTAFIEQLRQELPRLLREHPEVRHELWGIMLEAFPSRQEFMAFLEEMRAFREDTNRRFEELRQDMNSHFEELRQDMNSHFEAVDRRFEAVDRRFEAVDRRFEAVDRRFEAVDRRFEAVIAELQRHGEELRVHGRELRELTLHVSSLGGRVGRNLEHVVREVVEEFAGQAFPVAERLVLRDEAGAVFGVANAEVEFDLYAHNGVAYLVEVKSHLKPSDVLTFYQKVRFAEAKLRRQVIPLIIALSMEPRAEQQMQQLGVKYRVRSVIS